MSTHKITVTLDLDPDLFRQQRHALIEMLATSTADTERGHIEGLISLMDHIADVAADEYGLESCLLTESDIPILRETHLTHEGIPITIGEGWDHYSDGDCYFFHISVDEQREITIDYDVDKDNNNNLRGQPACFVDRDIRNDKNERTDYAAITLAEDSREILDILAMPKADVLQRFARQIEDVKTEPTDHSKL